jgi:hypothetical protein
MDGAFLILIIMDLIKLKVERAEKRKDKIIIVLKSNLYSGEDFACNPFHKDIDQLQDLKIDVEIIEDHGKLHAKAKFKDYAHYTKGHTQITDNLTNYFLSTKDCARDWVLNEKEEYFNEERIKKVLDIWSNDQDFHSELTSLILQRKNKIKKNKINKAKEEVKKAVKKLNKLIGD